MKDKYLDLSSNKKFLIWLKNKINKENYKLLIPISSMQLLINKIVNWYEIKYPDRYFEIYGKNNFDISKILDYQQLLYTFNDKELDFLNCIFRGNGFFNSKKYYNISDLSNEDITTLVSVFLNKKDNIIEPEQIYLYVNIRTGEIKKRYELTQYITTKNINIRDLKKYLEEKNYGKYNCDEIDKLLLTNKNDILLRKKVLEFIILKLIYSKNSSFGYQRAKIFVKEFNDNIVDLNLDIEEVLKENVDEKNNVKNVSEKILKIK